MVQVSDRRITSLAGGSLLEDDRNKGTLVGSAFAFAYSGLADLAGMHTDVWFTHRVAEAQRAGVPWPTHVRDSATDLFRTCPLDRCHRWHAFVGVGWVPANDGSSQLWPACMTISNGIARDGAKLVVPSEKFLVGVEAITPSAPYRLCSPIGAPLSREQWTSACRRIARCVDHDVHPLHLMRILATAVWTTSQSYATIGRSLLGMIVPKSSASSGRVFLGTPVGPEALWQPVDSPMFFNIPGDCMALHWHMPNFVAGNSVFTEGTFMYGLPNNVVGREAR